MSLLIIWQFLPLPQLPLVFTARSDRVYLPMLGRWAVQSVLELESLTAMVSLPIFTNHMWMWDHPFCHHCGLFAADCVSAPLCLSVTLPLLSIWMNVASLNPWLLDFLTAQFSDNSGCYLFWTLLIIISVVVRGGEACLPTPPTWPEVIIYV